jgi:outer membrane murein-binding lipoprotein Lpp
VNTVRRISIVSAAILGTMALAACSSARDDFQKASAQNTLAAYQNFLKEHPNTDLAVQAQDRIHAMQDEQAWSSAQKNNTIEAFQQYLHDQPNGVHASESRDRITALQRADAWKASLADGKQPAIEAFLQKYPVGPEADEAHAKLETLKSQQYRVQVAEFRAARDADRARTRLQSKYGKLLHDVVVVPPTATDKLTTVRSAPMTLKDAESACGTLKKEHQHCEVVKG